MAEQYAFETREEREAFAAFVEADRANFEFDVETRLALAWNAGREYLTSELRLGVDTPDEFRREFSPPRRDAEPRLELDDTMEMAEAVGVALGYVSACWTRLADAGVFESGRAEQASIELQRFIEERTQSREFDGPCTGDLAFLNQFGPAKLGLATTEQLFNELHARRYGGSHPNYTTASEQKFDEDRDYFDGRVLGLTEQGQPVKQDAPKLEIGLSEYGRGLEAGLGEYADRQLRLAALGHAVSSTTPGHSSETVMARANEYLSFLLG